MSLMERLHYNIATNGVRAGHKILAKFGFGKWQVQIQVESTSGSPWIPAEDFYIVVKVTSPKGKVYTKSYKASEHGLRHFIKVVATFTSINQVFSSITVKIKHVSISSYKSFVKLFSR